MNIVFALSEFFPDVYGGAEVYTNSLAAEFLQRGHQIHVICARRKSGSNRVPIGTEDEIYQGIPVRRILFDPSARPERLRQIMYDPEIAQHVGRALREWDAEIIHITYFPFISAATIPVAKQLGIPIVWTATLFDMICARGALIKWDGSLCPGRATFEGCWDCLRPRGMRTQRIYGWTARLPKDLICSLARLKQVARFNKLGWLDTALIVEARLGTLLPLLRQIDLSIAPCTWMRDVLVMNGADSERVVVSLHGIPPDSHKPRVRTGDSSLQFAFLGRIHPVKGVDVLIGAFNRLASPRGATLTIYGAPGPHQFEYAGKLWFMAKDNPRIIFGKQVEREQIGAVLENIDVLIVPSVSYENSPVVIQEAQYHRIPVIASRIAGVADLIRDGENGLLFEMGDVADLASKMQRLIDKPALVQQLSSRIQPVKTICQDAEWLLSKYEGLSRIPKKG